MNTPIDDDLLLKFKTGDKNAFEDVFKDNYKQLRLTAFLLLNNEFDAEDIVQQTFMDIWNRALYKNIDTSLKAYLHKAVRNRCLNVLTKRKIVEKAAEEYSSAVSYNLYEEESGNYSELSSLVKTSLDTFPQQRQTAFNLVYLQDKSYKEAAMQMGITINSLKTHIKIGLKQLRSVLRTS